MKRDLSFIVSILCNAAEYEAKGAPTVFVPEQMSDKQRAADMVYWGEMLVNSGFLRRVATQPDTQPWDLYRITWKGYCLIDLYEFWGEQFNSDYQSLETASARIALLSLF